MDDVRNLKKADAKKAGGYVKEKLIIARSRITSNEVERAIFKATSHKLKPPNEKHVVRLLEASYGHYSDDERVTMAKIVAELEKRLHSHNWIVVLKTLGTLHTLLKQGSKAIVLAICQRSGLFHTMHLKDLDDDKHGLYSQFITKYARYLEEWCMAYLHMNCAHTVDKPKELAAELEAMSTHKAIRATQSLSLQLGVLVGLDFAASRNLWNENDCTTYCLNLVLKDSKNLYILLSYRSLWLLKHGMKLNDGEKHELLGIFKEYMEHSEKLLRMFEQLQGTTFGKQHGDKIPTLTNYPKETIDQLTRYLSAPHAAAAAAPSLVGAFAAEIASAPVAPVIPLAALAPELGGAAADAAPARVGGARAGSPDGSSDTSSPAPSPSRGVGAGVAATATAAAATAQAVHTQAWLADPKAFRTPQRGGGHDDVEGLPPPAKVATPPAPPAAPPATAAQHYRDPAAATALPAQAEVDDFFNPRAAAPAAQTLAPPAAQAPSPLDDLFGSAPTAAAAQTAPPASAGAGGVADLFASQPPQQASASAFPFPGQQPATHDLFASHRGGPPAPANTDSFLNLSSPVDKNAIWMPQQAPPPQREAPPPPPPPSANTLDDLFA